MKRTDSVFFFVLVDFFLQVVFLGLVLYAGSLAIRGAGDDVSDAERLAALDRMRERTGISDLDSLTDRLTRLVPAESASGRRVFERLDTLFAVSDSQGGPSALRNRLRDLTELERRVGVVPCVSEVANGRVRATVIGEGVLTDAYFALDSTTPRLAAVLDSAHITAASAQRVPLDQLPEVFGRIRALHPSCFYRLRVDIKTAYRDPVLRLVRYFDVVASHE